MWIECACPSFWQAMWLYDNDPALKGLSAFLDQNFRGMRVALNQQQTPFLWQVRRA